MPIPAFLLARAPRLPVFLAAARMNEPSHYALLVWPALWASYVAGNGQPATATVLVLLASVVLMQAAGQALAAWLGRAEAGSAKGLESGEGLAFCAALGALALLFPLFLGKGAFAWALPGLLLVLAYPFLQKRSFLAQGLLAAALSWTVPAAFLAEGKGLEPIAWLLFAASLCWLLASDTFRAIAEREQASQQGIKSTALLLGDMDLLVVGSLQAMFLLALWMLAGRLGLAWPFTVTLLGAIALFVWQFRHAGEREAQRCQEAYLHNHWVGALLFAGVFLGYLLKAALVLPVG